MNSEGSKPPRRIRYKGTHPKTFREKYKEHNPERYGEELEKALKKGRTPAGMHRSICVDEIIEFLHVQPGQTGLDATLGYGGHSVEILKRLEPGGKLYALDVDPIELPKTKERLALLGYGDAIFHPWKMNFSDIDRVVAESGPLHFILADLGLSSMQIDNPERGFFLKDDGPLDLRLNPQSGKSAAKMLQSVKQEKLEEILAENADEPYAGVIAEAILDARDRGQSPETTNQLKDIIADAMRFVAEKDRADLVKKTSQRVFQALRIEVNDEFGVLEKFLSKLPDALLPGGRVAILTFHSGEDRRVKKAFQLYFREGIFSEVAPEPIRPSAEEIYNNPRARSAKLRWGIAGHS